MSRRGNGGFTLVEAMVALTIMGLAVVTLLTATARAVEAERGAVAHREAVTLADAKLNELAGLPRWALAEYAGRKGGRFSGELDRYEWTANVEISPDSPRLLLAEVVVRWPEGSVALETTLYRVARIGVGGGDAR